MDTHPNIQKLCSGDLTISTSFHLDVSEDEEILSTVHRANEDIDVQNRISTSDTSIMNSSKSKAQDLKNLLEDLQKLWKEAEESVRKNVLKKHKSVRNLKEAEKEEKYQLFNNVIQIKTSNRGKSELLYSILGISEGIGLVGCLLPTPVAAVALPLSVGAAAVPAATGCSLSAILLRREIRKAQEARSGVITLLDEKSRKQVLRQFILQTAILMLLMGIYFTESEETRAKKTKIGSPHHPQCGCHFSSFQRNTTFWCPSVSAGRNCQLLAY